MNDAESLTTYGCVFDAVRLFVLVPIF